MFVEKLEYYFGEDSLWVSLIILGIAIAAAIIFNIIIAAIFKIVSNRTKKPIVVTFLDELKYPLFFFIIIVALTSSIPFTEFNESTLNFLKHVVSILIIVSVAWLAINAVDVARAVILRRYDVESQNNLEARKVVTQFKVLQQIIVVIIIVIAFAAALMTFEKVRQLGTSILASAGVLGIIIGFAAQKSIATFVAGFQIAITQPIRLDDVVIVEDEWGRIEEITLTYVVIKIWNERRLVVPINYFIEKPFQNWTRTSSQILGAVFIYTDYRIPFDDLRKELTRLLEQRPDWDKRVNALQVTDATENTVQIRALMSSGNASENWNLRVYVREKLIEYIRNNYPESLPKSRVEIAGIDKALKNELKS